MQAETYERNGLQVEILYEQDPESPREWDNLGTMICSHRRYTLGDEQFDPDEFENWKQLEDHLYKEGAGIVVPLGLYDHSGITMYIGETHDKWDGGQVGFIYVQNERLEEEYGVIGCDELEKAKEVLKHEVETYDKYLTGEVYGFIITKNGEEIDSCWGFYGIEDVRNEANSVADNYKHPRQAKYAPRASLLHG